MKQASGETIKHLCRVLEWAKGNRGRRDVNPYGVPEIIGALDHVAYLQGSDEYLDADTTVPEDMVDKKRLVPQG